MLQAFSQPKVTQGWFRSLDREALHCKPPAHAMVMPLNLNEGRARFASREPIVIGHRMASQILRRFRSTRSRRAIERH